MRFVTSDPRSGAGLADQVGANVAYVSGGEIAILVKTATGATDWASVGATVAPAPMNSVKCPAVSADPRTGAGRTATIGDVVLYYTGGVGIYLIKYGAAATSWAPLPSTASLVSGAGSGTTNTVTKWTSSTAIGNSSITDTGSLVTVTNPLTVTGALTLSTMTEGSVLFAGPSGLVSQYNAGLFWDDSLRQLRLTGPASSSPLLVTSTSGSGQVGLRNLAVAGLVDVYMNDDAGTTRAAFGYANASNSDAQRVGKIYVWRDAGKDFVVTRTGATDLVVGSTGSIIAGAAAVTKSGFTHEFTKDAAQSVAISSYGTGTTPELMIFRGRGTGAATTAVASGDVLGALSFVGAQSATAIKSGVFMRSLTTEAWSTGASGAKLQVFTTATGGVSTTQKLGVENDGGITLTNSATAAVSASNELRLRYNTTGHVLQTSANAGAYVTVATGAGTANLMTKWSNTTGLLTNSIVTDNGTTVSVAGALSVTGAASIDGNAALGNATTDSHTINGRLTHLCPGTPSESNYVQRANGLGALSTMVYAADNVFIAYDADWTGSAWIARDTSVARLYKNSDTFYLQGSTGNSVDGAASFNTIASFDLATGNASLTGSCTLGDAAGDTHTVNGTVDFNHAVNVDGAVTATSTVAVSGAFSAAASFATGGDVVAPQIAANQNDYAPTGIGDASMLFISSDAARDITGITSGSVDGRHLWVFNEGNFNITLKQGSASSAAANRFHLRTGADLVLAPSTGAHLYWAGTKGFWIQIGTL